MQALVIGVAVASSVAGAALLLLLFLAGRRMRTAAARRRQRYLKDAKLSAALGHGLGMGELDASQMDMGANLGLGPLPKINRNASWKRSYVSWGWGSEERETRTLLWGCLYVCVCVCVWEKGGGCNGIPSMVAASGRAWLGTFGGCCRIGCGCGFAGQCAHRCIDASMHGCSLGMWQASTPCPAMQLMDAR